MAKPIYFAGDPLINQNYWGLFQEKKLLLCPKGRQFGCIYTGARELLTHF
jgi:hypothetical protein